MIEAERSSGQKTHAVPGQADGFLAAYVKAFSTIEGWYSPDAALLLMAYNQLIAGDVSGDVIEIGVFKGLSAIGLAAMRPPRSRFVAVDIFDGAPDAHGMRAQFERNIGLFFDDLSFMTVIADSSATLEAEDLGGRFCFAHVDADHAAGPTYHDMSLCADILQPGGLLALDDYFNWTHPGVCEGALRLHHEQPGRLRPLAIGFNKVLFQKQPAMMDLNAAFRGAFPDVPVQESAMWGWPVLLFTGGFLPYIDLGASSPRSLRPLRNLRAAATIEPLESGFEGRAGELIHVPVRVVNRCGLTFAAGQFSPFRISYHLRSDDGRMLRFDNERSYLRRALLPNETQDADVIVHVPNEKGLYEVELDLVWENVLWFGDRGNRTVTVALNSV